MTTIPTKIILARNASSKHDSNLSIEMPKRVGDKEQLCLTPILISSNQPLLFLNSTITFSYNLIVASLVSKGNLYLFWYIPKIISRHCIKSFPKVDEATQGILRKKNIQKGNGSA